MDIASAVQFIRLDQMSIDSPKLFDRTNSSNIPNVLFEIARGVRLIFCTSASLSKPKSVWSFQLIFAFADWWWFVLNSRWNVRNLLVLIVASVLVPLILVSIISFVSIIVSLSVSLSMSLISIPVSIIVSVIPIVSVISLKNIIQIHLLRQ